MSDGPTHRRISRAIAAPVAAGTLLLSHRWLLALSAGVACYLSGCGPDRDQTEAHMPLWLKVVSAAAWCTGGLRFLWWLKDAPAP